MIFASEKDEKAAHFRFRVDHHSVTHGEVGRNGAVKFGAIAIDVRVDGSKNLNVENGSLGESVDGISVRMPKTGLQVKRQNRPRRNADRFDARRGSLRK